MCRGKAYHRARLLDHSHGPARRLQDSWSMTPFETIPVEGRIVACNGGGGPLGHPRVYLNLMPSGKVECPYCSRLYVNRAMAEAGEAAPGGSAGPVEGASGIPAPADTEAPPYPGVTAAASAPPAEANDG